MLLSMYILYIYITWRATTNTKTSVKSHSTPTTHTSTQTHTLEHRVDSEKYGFFIQHRRRASSQPPTRAKWKIRMTKQKITHTLTQKTHTLLLHILYIDNTMPTTRQDVENSSVSRYALCLYLPVCIPDNDAYSLLHLPCN